ncbi:hypothetical protein [Natronosalvus vescus]|uniref:hypothetical protein n=1 Tax=Natronosalvus vescus TaxID=2953881 RepID=UPI0020900CAC|nr:hypothetical protein [Natronosalvus vescus]
MADERDDSTPIRSLAVTAEDVVDAFGYTRENPGEAVLRVTPPFHGRMRARLHVFQVDDSPETGAIHLEPERLLEDEAVDAYPTLESVAATMDESADPETVRERHADALDAWRRRARAAIVGAVDLETDTGSHRVSVSVLGQS